MKYAKTTNEVAQHWENNAENWTHLSRAGHDVYRDKHNTPTFLASLPDISGLVGLDIGCGEGSNTRSLAEKGATMRAIDVAPTFISHAKNFETNNPLGILYSVADATSLTFDDQLFDFATAFMSMMDIINQKLAVEEAFRVIRSGGFFQFSILHPCFAPPHRVVLRNKDGKSYAVEVADYFEELDGRIEEWTFGKRHQGEKPSAEFFKVPRFHRTISSWINLLITSGFRIEYLGEPTATKDEAMRYPEISDTMIVPLFIHIRVRKPKA